MKNRVDMVNGNLFSGIIKFALPIILSSILQVFYSAADSLILSRYDNPLSLGAVSSAGGISSCIVNFFIGITVGVNVLSARFVGSGDKKSLQLCGHNAIFLGLIFGIIILIIGQIVARPMANLIGIAPEIKEGCITYLRYYMAGIPFISLTNFVAAFLRGTGNSKGPTISLVVSGGINVVLNIIFVKHFNMGIHGVASATVISQIIACILIMKLYATDPSGSHISLVKPDFEMLKRIIYFGLPVGIQNILNSVSNIFTTAAMNKFGAEALAGENIELQLEALLCVAVSAVGIAVMTFASQNLGAGKHDRLGKIFRVGFLIASAFCIIGTALVYWIRIPYVNFFAPNSPEITKYALLKMDMIILPFITYAIDEIPTYMLRGVGETFLAMIITLLCNCAFRVFWILVLLPYHNTVGFLFLSYPVSWTMMGVVATAIYSAKIKQILNIQK